MGGLSMLRRSTLEERIRQISSDFHRAERLAFGSKVEHQTIGHHKLDLKENENTVQYSEDQ